VSIVERKPSGRAQTLIEILGLRIESLSAALPSGTRMAREAIVDLLKFAFNILTHYPKVRLVPSPSFPRFSSLYQLVECEKVVESGSNDDAKVMGEYWSDRLDGFV
jgi:hypothetical protein